MHEEFEVNIQHLIHTTAQIAHKDDGTIEHELSLNKTDKL